jgi:hypothetical protein
VVLILSIAYRLGIKMAWIDNMCINQVNRLEKGDQVRQTGGKFPGTRDVILDLGRASYLTDYALDQFTRHLPSNPPGNT